MFNFFGEINEKVIFSINLILSLARVSTCNFSLPIIVVDRKISLNTIHKLINVICIFLAEIYHCIT